MIVETDASEEADAQVSFSPDVVFDLIKSRRRRYVFQYLRSDENPTRLSDLAEQVAAWENDTTVDDVSDRNRKGVYTSLYQTHLPMMDEAGIIEYDKRQGLIELKPEAIRAMGEHLQDPWAYLGGRPVAESAQTQFSWTYVLAGLLVLDAGAASFVRTPPFVTIAQVALPVLALGLFVALYRSRDASP